MTFNVGSGKILTLRDNGIQIQNVAFVFEATNSITIENLNTISANDYADSANSTAGY